MAKIIKRERKGGAKWGIDYYDANGERHRKMVGTKAEAESALSEVRSRIANLRGGIVDNSYAFDDLAKKFMRYHKLRVRKSTFKRSEGLLANLREEFGGRNIKSISLDDVDEYCERRLAGDEDDDEGGVSRRTVNLEIGFLKQMFKFGVERRLIGMSPVAMWQPLKETDKKKPRALDAEEVRLLLEHATDTMRPVWLTFVTTGMRKGELVNLRWSDVDLDNGIIHIRCRDDWKTKNGEDREVHISEATELWTELKRLRLAAKPKAKYVFTTVAGRQRRHNFIRQLRGTAKRAGIKDPESITVHSLRHTVATRMSREGVSLKVVQDVLGHKNVSVTLGYTSVNNNDRRKAVGHLSYEADPEKCAHQPGTDSEGLPQVGVG